MVFTLSRHTGATQIKKAFKFSVMLKVLLFLIVDLVTTKTFGLALYKNKRIAPKP